MTAELARLATLAAVLGLVGGAVVSAPRPPAPAVPAEVHAPRAVRAGGSSPRTGGRALPPSAPRAPATAKTPVPVGAPPDVAAPLRTRRVEGRLLAAEGRPALRDAWVLALELGTALRRVRGAYDHARAAAALFGRPGGAWRAPPDATPVGASGRFELVVRSGSAATLLLAGALGAPTRVELLDVEEPLLLGPWSLEVGPTATLRLQALDQDGAPLAEALLGFELEGVPSTLDAVTLVGAAREAPEVAELLADPTGRPPRASLEVALDGDGRASVELPPGAEGTAWASVTWRDGSRCAPGGDATIVVLADTAASLDAGGEASLVLRRTRGGPSLAVRTVDPLGRPVPGARISVRRAEDPAREWPPRARGAGPVTDAAGVAILVDVEAGDVEVVGREGSRAGRSGLLPVPRGRALELVLDQQLEVGDVQLAGRDAATGASVLLLEVWSAGPLGVAPRVHALAAWPRDSSPFELVDLPAGRWRLTARPDDERHALRDVEVAVVAGVAQVCTIDFAAGAAFEGRVVGARAGRVELWLGGHLARSSALGPDGDFTLAGLPDGQPLDLRLVAAGPTGLVWSPIVLVGLRAPATLLVPLPREPVTRLRTRRAGREAWGESIDLLLPDGQVVSGRTRWDGLLEVRGPLPAGARVRIGEAEPAPLREGEDRTVLLGD